jgi:hypothetical protein
VKVSKLNSENRSLTKEVEDGKRRIKAIEKDASMHKRRNSETKLKSVPTSSKKTFGSRAASG